MDVRYCARLNQTVSNKNWHVLTSLNNTKKSGQRSVTDKNQTTSDKLSACLSKEMWSSESDMFGIQDPCWWLLFIPVFSTWSIHILTKLGTDVFSLWHKLVRLQPNTWSVKQQKHIHHTHHLATLYAIIQTVAHIHIYTYMWQIIKKGVNACIIFCVNTFDVSFVSDCLICWPTCQELLELHPGFLLVWRVHTHRGLHDWRVTGR